MLRENSLPRPLHAAALILVLTGAVFASHVTEAQPERSTASSLRFSAVELEPEHADFSDLMPSRPSRSRVFTFSSDPLYSLPFKGEDLAASERYYRRKKIHTKNENHGQHWGYDLAAMRKVDGKWKTVKSSYDPKNPKNSAAFVYGKPVYAMAAGKVVRCWRNAPDNPRPFSSALGDHKDDAVKKWLHPKFRDGFIPGGGNSLVIEDSAGNLILYAHFAPGSIPSKICPNNATYYSSAKNTSETDVAPAQQATLAEGQFLGRVGNSGSSSGPHLHVHKVDAAKKPRQLKFKHGLATPLVNGKADLDDITSFKGERIPPGKVLIWPPRTIGVEYARHGYPVRYYQRLFHHLVDSGAWPEWIDGYSVAGKPYLNFVWRKAQGAFRAYHLLSSSQYQAKFNQAKEDQYAPVQVESSLVGGKVRYSVIFVKNKPGGFMARHGLTYDQHLAVLNEAKSKNLAPINVSVVSVGGERRYTVLYRSAPLGGWQLKSRVPAARYQALYNANVGAGRRPHYVQAYMHKGDPYFSVIFSQKPKGNRKDRHGLSAAAYQTEFNSAHQAKLLTRAVSGYDGAKSNHRFIAYWRK